MRQLAPVLPDLAPATAFWHRIATKVLKYYDNKILLVHPSILYPAPPMSQTCRSPQFVQLRVPVNHPRSFNFKHPIDRNNWCQKRYNLMVFWLFLRSVNPGRENRPPKNVGNYRCFVHFLRSPTDRSIEVQKYQILVVFWRFFRSVATGRRRYSKINNIDVQCSHSN